MEPFTAIAVGMAGVSAVSALAQMYQSKAASKANKAELQRIEAIFNKIVPPKYGVSVTDDPDLITEVVPPPAYNLDAIDLDDFQYIGDFAPEVAQYVGYARPELVQDSAAGLEGRNAQMEALRRLQSIASSDFDPDLQDKMLKAKRAIQGEAQSRSKSILEDQNRRGSLGSTKAMVAQIAGSSAAMDRGAMAASEAAAEGYRNQLGALRDSASLGSSVLQQDRSMSERNADSLNRFNEMSAKSYQNYLDSAADAANKAKLRNLETRQGLATKNTAQSNEQLLAERARQDQIKQQVYNMKIKERDYTNEMRDRAFKNEVALGQAASGRAGDMMTWRNQNAANDINAIQGLTNAALGAAAPAASNAQEDQAFENWRRYYDYQRQNPGSKSYGGGGSGGAGSEPRQAGIYP